MHRHVSGNGSLASNGAQDVMEVRGAEKKHLLPWVAAIVKTVDLESRRVVVDWGSDW